MSFQDVIPVLLPELILVVTACALFLIGTVARASARRVVPFLALAALVLVAVMLVSPASFGLEAPTQWQVLKDPLGALRVGTMGWYIKLLSALVGAMFVLLSWPTNRDASGNRALAFGADACGEYFALLLLCIAGIFLVAGANDLILLFLGIELASIPTYIMVSISRPIPVAQEAGVKYFFLGAMSAAIMLFGFSYLYGTTGLIRLDQLTAYFASLGGAGNVIPPLSRWQLLALVMLIVGFSFKIAAVPMHFYAGDVYEGAATPVTALLSFVPKTSGFVALIKILFVVSGGSWMVAPQIATLVWVLAVLTMTVGNVLGLMQQNVKRVLAYSSIAHTGYMLVGLAVLLDGRVDEALQGILFYLTAYGITNVAAFGVLMLLPGQKDRPGSSAETFEDLAGTGRRNIGLGLVMAVACFSLTGLPFTIGFFGKFFLIRPALIAGDYWLVIIMVINAAISAGYYLRIVATMFLRPESQPHGTAAPLPDSAATAAPAAAQVERATPILLAISLSTAAMLLFGVVFPATQMLRIQAMQSTTVDVRPLSAAPAPQP